MISPPIYESKLELFQIPSPHSHNASPNLSRHAITSETEVSRAIVTCSAYWWRSSSDTRDDDGTVARYSDGVTLLLTTGNAVSLDHGGTVGPRAQEQAGYERHEGGHAIKSLDTSRWTRYTFLQLHRNQPLDWTPDFARVAKAAPFLLWELSVCTEYVIITFTLSSSYVIGW